MIGLLRVDLPPTGSAFGQGLLVVARECGIADTPEREQPAMKEQLEYGTRAFARDHCLALISR